MKVVSSGGVNNVTSASNNYIKNLHANYIRPYSYYTIIAACGNRDNIITLPPTRAHKTSRSERGQLAPAGTAWNLYQSLTTDGLNRRLIVLSSNGYLI